MPDTNAVGVAALAISLLALVISAIFAARQVALMRNANYVPILVDLLSQFRSLEFNDNYRYVCTRLLTEHDPAAGISGLPDETRTKIYDIAYYYQSFAALTALKVVQDRHIVAVLRDRIVNVWHAIEPFVQTERQINPSTGPFLLRNLEEFAVVARAAAAGGPKKAARMPSSTVDRFMRGRPPATLESSAYPWRRR